MVGRWVIVTDSLLHLHPPDRREMLLAEGRNAGWEIQISCPLQSVHLPYRDYESEVDDMVFKGEWEDP